MSIESIVSKEKTQQVETLMAYMAELLDLNIKFKALGIDLESCVNADLLELQIDKVIKENI